MLRVLAESFVVSPPSGVTIKTRLRSTPAEEQALREVGTFLGSLYRADLVTRLSQGKLDAHGRAQSRKVRKKYLTAQSSSRWAGSITRATQDPYDLAAGGTGCRAGHARRGDRQAVGAGGGPGRRPGRQDRRVPQRGRAARQDPAPGPAHVPPGRGGHHAGVGPAECGPGRQTALADPEQPGAGKPERPGVGVSLGAPADVPER